MTDEKNLKKDFLEEKTNEIIEFMEERLKHYFYKDYSRNLVNAVVDLKKEGSILATKQN